jgi:hypothetical protein
MPKPNDSTPNFLTCPAFPELEPPKSSVLLEEGTTPEVLKELVAPAAPGKMKTIQKARGPEGQGAGSPAENQSGQTALSRAIPPVKQANQQGANHPRRRHSYLFWVILAIIVIIVALTGPALVALARAGIAVQSARTSLAGAVAHAEKSEFNDASADLGAAQRSLAVARDVLNGTGFWRDIPGIGTQIRAIQDAASAGSATLDGVHDLVNVASSVLDAASRANAVTGELVNPVDAHRTFKDLTAEEKRSILAKLNSQVPEIRVAQAKINVALDTWSHIPQNSLFGPLRTALKPIADNLPRLKQSLDEALPLLETLIPLAGYPKPADYIVVLQNSQELRATGGFLGTVGTLEVDGGDLKTFAFGDVYNLDNPASGKWKEVPPDPIKQRLGVPAWYFRDANWSPDFPTSAEKLMDFYVREIYTGTGKTVPKPGGVIALNPPFFQLLLRMTGPITIDGFTFDANNFFDQLEYQVEVGYLSKGTIPQSQRKEIVAKLGDALLAKLTELPASRWPDLLDLATQSLERKQIQVYSSDPELLKRLDAFGWTGRTKATNGDFLQVIDSNLAGLKTDGVMVKRVKYQVDATDPYRPVATVTLSYTNNAPGLSDFRYSRYRDYVRVYVPEGSQLIDSQGAMKDDRYKTGGRFTPGPVDVYKDLGKTVFGAFWSIEPKATQEITFTYVLPQVVRDGLQDSKYRLDWPKQSGVDEAALTLNLKFGKKLQHATPPEASTEFGDANYRVTTDSLTDRTFQISF